MFTIMCSWMTPPTILCLIFWNVTATQAWLNFTKHNDQTLVETPMLNLTSIPDVLNCAILCQQLSRCSSIGFKSNNTQCLLFENNTSNKPLEVSMGTVFMEIQPDASLVSSCAARPCAPDGFCIPAASGQHHCAMLC